MAARKEGVEFTLLPNGDVLVTVTVAAGEPGHSDITSTARYRLSGTDFCAKAFPIFYQYYRDSWPPPPHHQDNAPKYKDGVRQMLDKPHDESLQPPDKDGIRRMHTRGLPGG